MPSKRNIRRIENDLSSTQQRLAANEAHIKSLLSTQAPDEPTYKSIGPHTHHHIFSHHSTEKKRHAS